MFRKSRLKKELRVLSLLVMVPTRWRRENCERLLKSFMEATDHAELVFITDADDQDTYADMDWGDATNAILDMGDLRVGTTAKVNHVSAVAIDDYDAFMYIGDDHLFSTPHWDTILLGELEKMGGSGMIYGDDKRRVDIPEMIVITSDVVEMLGHFAEPTLAHYYIDNVWAELGRRSGLLRYFPEVVFEHLHYQVHPEVEHDQTYVSAENLWGQADLAAFHKWRDSVMALEVAKLRRGFNRDVQWILGKVLCVAYVIGQISVASATVPVFTIPAGLCNVTFWNPAAGTVYIGTSTAVTTSNGLQCHSIPTSFFT
ncbi:MAG TPA: hypothetical protein VGR89_11305, partial [Puia sp.]|nr:hypothetical protein [Puia sp.]